MDILIHISDENVPKRQGIFDVALHFIDGHVCSCTYPFTELKKGHGRLKDVDRLEPHDEYDGQGFTQSVYKDDIDDLPTIIEADNAENEDK